MDIRLALMSGIDIPIPQCQLVIHQPTIKDISYIGDEDFFKGVQCLSLSKSMFVKDKDALDKVSNFQIFMTIMNEKETVDKKNAVKQIFLLTFPDYRVLFTPRSLIFQKENEVNITIDENNFDFLQSMMREIFCSKNGPMDSQAFNPANDKAKEIAEKLMRGRQRVAEQKGSAQTSVFSQYMSILSVGLHIPITNFLEYTMYQLFDTMDRYSLYINWDIDIRSRLAGGKPDSQPDNWMKNIHQ